MITYKYKLYENRQNKKLDDLCRSSAFVWNHCLNLQQRYYRLYKGYISLYRLQSHFAKKVLPKHDFLKLMNSQSIQEIIERLDTSYKRFFKKIQKRPPKFKSGWGFQSFLFKQTGFSLDGNTFRINKLNKTYKFHYSRAYGKPRQVIIKRNKLNEYFIYIISEEDVRKQNNKYRKTHDGASVGIDFGLKTYLTLSDNNVYESPLFFKTDIKKIKKASKQLSSKDRVKTGKKKYSKKYKKDVDITKYSNNGEKARKNLCRAYNDISNKRKDYQYKLAHELCKKYDYIFIEDLNLTGMSRLWGRKMHDLAHGSFIKILEQVALKYGVIVHKIDRWYPSSKTCFDCGYINKELTLKDREWVCPQCGSIHDRDDNASKNINRKGISEYRSDCKISREADIS